MVDDRDYFQRRVEMKVRLAEPARAILAIVAVVGGLLLVAFGAGLLLADRAKMPHPTGTMLLAVFIVLLGLGFAYVGGRLLLLSSENAHLLSPRGTRIASYCVAVVGVFAIVTSLFARNLYFSATGLGALLVAYWLYTSAKRVRE
jgi:hypothetical protein